MTGINDLNNVFGTHGPTKAEPRSTDLTATNGDAQSDSVQTTGVDRSAVSTVAGALVRAVTTSDVRSDKVEQLKAAIAAGSYHVDTSAVADKMMKSMLGDS